ncbi:glutamate racemase [bacterium]|nr:glutamate racemase [bacterium]
MTLNNESVNSPVGIFDSGLGGLTVVKAVRERMPKEDVIYYGDTAHVPYGSKSQETILSFTQDAVDFFLSHDVKCIVIACNTATALALPEIKATSPVPVLGVIDAGARAAISASKNYKIGVIGTQATIASEAYTKTLRKLNPACAIYAHPCPLFVPLVEEGWLDRPATKMVIEEYLKPLKMAQIDTLILGCTHYPLLAGSISEFLGPDVKLVDSASSCAEELEGILREKGLLRSEGTGSETFFVTDGAAKFAETGSRFLGRSLQAIKFTPSK